MHFKYSQVLLLTSAIIILSPVLGAPCRRDGLCSKEALAVRAAKDWTPSSLSTEELPIPREQLQVSKRSASPGSWPSRHIGDETGPPPAALDTNTQGHIPNQNKDESSSPTLERSESSQSGLMVEERPIVYLSANERKRIEEKSDFQMRYGDRRDWKRSPKAAIKRDAKPGRPGIRAKGKPNIIQGPVKQSAQRESRRFRLSGETAARRMGRRPNGGQRVAGGVRAPPNTPAGK